MSTYEPRSFWEDRLRKKFGFSGVCHASFNDYYNRWLHRARTRVLRKALTRVDGTVGGRSVCDFGCGTGLILNFFRQRGAREIWGVDLTEVSVERLGHEHPGDHFLLADIASGDLAERIGRQFDFVTAFDVFYHVPDQEGAFERALGNACKLVREGGLLLATDAAGAEDTQCAPHVRWRSRGRYDKVFEGFKMEIIELMPLYSLMNEPQLSARAPARLRKWARRADNMAAPLYFFLDLVLVHVRPHPLRLIVARKQGEEG